MMPNCEPGTDLSISTSHLCKTLIFLPGQKPGKHNFSKCSSIFFQEEELKELQQQLEQMFIRKTTTSQVQTSPFPDKQYQVPSSRIPTPTPKVVPQTPKVLYM